MASDTLNPGIIGPVDSSARVAPAGGSHTGTSVITMQDGAQFTVASNAAEVKRKVGAILPGDAGRWMAFDVPNSAVPVVLNTNNFKSVR